MTIVASSRVDGLYAGDGQQNRLRAGAMAGGYDPNIGELVNSFQ
jgi:hypothetical protein